MTSKMDVKKIEHYLDKFNQDKADIEKIREGYLSDEIKYDIKKQYVKMIEDALNSMSYESYRIVLNDFILHKPTNWYQEYYCKSTYYLHRTKAIEEFLHCLGA